jgi:DNA (cytosine-5)-methyltransferase 1
VSAFISKFYKSGTGQDIREPLHTITTSPGHFAEVRAFLMSYYGGNSKSIGQRLDTPLRTITTKDRFGIVTVAGHDYQIADIGLRMLTPRELFNAQGFPEDYIIDFEVDGRQYPKSEQVAKCGNSVSPVMPVALVRSNLPEICVNTSANSAGAI